MGQPPVTIILPIRNEANYLKACLESIFQQDYPHDCMEILIADGMSTDDSRAMIAELAARHPHINLRVLDNPCKIVPTGMNIALRQANGEVIIRVDGHTLIASDYVRQCVNVLERTQAENVGGKMTAIGSNPFGEAVALATSMPFGVGGARFHYSDQEEWVDTVYMGAWPRRVFEKYGLFDEELVRDQDDEFNYRLCELGGCIFLSPAIRSQYTVRSTLRSLWRQYYQYGFWKVRVLQKHPRQIRLHQFAPSGFVLALFVSAMFAFSPILRPLSIVIPLLYLIANLGASLLTAARHRWSAFIFLPPIYATLHLGYGLGLWVGLLKFANRWGDKQGQAPPFMGRDAGAN